MVTIGDVTRFPTNYRPSLVLSPPRNPPLLVPWRVLWAHDRGQPILIFVRNCFAPLNHRNTMAAPHNVQLYHATLEKFVKDIKEKIRLDLAKERTDFRRERQSFYLTDNYKTAKNVMAAEVGGFEGHPTAIMTFSLNLAGLKVKTFSKELSGPTLDEWRGVSESLASSCGSLLTIHSMLRIAENIGRRKTLSHHLIPS